MTEDFSPNLFSVNRVGTALKITNSSEYTLFVSLVPKKPKRTYRDIMVIRPKELRIIDQEVDIFSLAFRLSNT